MFFEGNSSVCKAAKKNRINILIEIQLPMMVTFWIRNIDTLLKFAIYKHICKTKLEWSLYVELEMYRKMEKDDSQCTLPDLLALLMK